MRGRLLRRLVIGILLIFQLSACFGKNNTDANDSSEYLTAVRTFAHKPEILFGIMEDY